LVSGRAPAGSSSPSRRGRRELPSIPGRGFHVETVPPESRESPRRKLKIARSREFTAGEPPDGPPGDGSTCTARSPLQQREALTCPVRAVPAAPAPPEPSPGGAPG